MTDYKQSDFILYAMRINGDGSGMPLEGDDISKEIKADQLAWVHMKADHPGTREWLMREVGYLDDLVLNALLAGETRPRYMEIGEGALIILRGVNLNENEEPEDMVSVRIWVDSHRIISVRKRQLKAVKDMQDHLIAGDGAVDSGDFIGRLCARLFERMEPVLSELDERTDNVEEEILDNPDAEDREEVIDIRKMAIMLRRYIAPQKEVMASMRLCDQPWMNEHDRRHVQESYDRAMRYVEDLDMIRERAQIVKDELANVLSDRLNKNMYVLSVIAAIFLPLGFLTGLLGINIGGIPGANDPHAFYWFCGGLAILVAAQMALFKKLKWV